MKRILVAYLSHSGTTEKMAQYIAEGVRIAGCEADLKSISEIRNYEDISGYDAYILGCPTYHLDMPDSFRSFLELAGKADVRGKAGGAFSSRTHPASSEGGGAAIPVFRMMESAFGMRMTSLGPFDIKAELIEMTEGMRACQDYGKSVAELVERNVQA
jgi:flavodoxin